MKDKTGYIVAGLMSGTSLDGLDIALCRFEKTDGSWDYSVIDAQTVPYSSEWRRKLINAETCAGLQLITLHKEYGHYLGEQILNFLERKTLKPSLISSHGHTIFHQPEKRLTFQLGDGAFIAAKTGITTVSDFRNLDVALNGQGAPLVPVGDELLFGSYGQCLNLGGFSNISYNWAGKRKAFDICPVNIVLNYLMNNYYQMDYDRDGEQGKKGSTNTTLLQQLNNLEFYKKTPPKSLGKEWVVDTVLPLIEASPANVQDKLRTVYENIATQLATAIDSLPGETVLTTGGGAFNKFLIELLKEKTSKNIVLPNSLVINFKEAFIFAFLGLLAYLGNINCLASVTGATKDNIGGVIHFV